MTQTRAYSFAVAECGARILVINEDDEIIGAMTQEAAQKMVEDLQAVLHDCNEEKAHDPS